MSGTVDWDMVTESKREKDKLCQCIKKRKMPYSLDLGQLESVFSSHARSTRGLFRLVSWSAAEKGLMGLKREAYRR